MRVCLVSTWSWVRFKIQKIGMSSNIIAGSGGGKTTKGTRTIKERLISEQANRMHYLHEDAKDALHKVMIMLQQVTAYKKEHPTSVDDLRKQFINSFIEIEEDLLSLLQDAYTDRQIYQCSTAFRATQKQIDSEYFRTMMTSHQKFKEKLNISIKRLQNDIQVLEGNGFHIYSHNPAANQVVALKKATLETYSRAMVEKTAIKEAINSKKQIKRMAHVLKQYEKNDEDKNAGNMRIVKKIYHKDMILQQEAVKRLHSLKKQGQKVSKQIKALESAIKKAQESKTVTIVQTQLLSCQKLSKSERKALWKSLKRQVDRIQIQVPSLYLSSPLIRSRSCCTLLQTHRVRVEAVSESMIPPESTHLLPSNFAQETLMI